MQTIWLPPQMNNPRPTGPGPRSRNHPRPSGGRGRSSGRHNHTYDNNNFNHNNTENNSNNGMQPSQRSYRPRTFQPRGMYVQPPPPPPRGAYIPPPPPFPRPITEPTQTPTNTMQPPSEHEMNNHPFVSFNLTPEFINPFSEEKMQSEPEPQMESKGEESEDFELISLYSLFGNVDDGEDETNNQNEAAANPYFPQIVQYERTIQELKAERNHLQKTLQSTIESSQKRIIALEKYEQLIEHASLPTIQSLSLSDCSQMKMKVKHLLSALEMQEIQLLKNKIKRDCYEDLYFCLICQEEERNVCFEPCGHFCLCTRCIENKKVKACPICRGEITATRRIYLG